MWSLGALVAEDTGNSMRVEAAESGKGVSHLARHRRRSMRMKSNDVESGYENDARECKGRAERAAGPGARKYTL